MTQNYQKGRTILGVILAIAVIALLLLLCLYACRSRVSEKVQDIEKEITLRKNLYCPEVPMDIPQYDAQKYIQNGPNGTTIILQNEMETPKIEGKSYFSILVDTRSRAICKKLVQSNPVNADLISINEDINGRCPGIIRFYFSCPYDLTKVSEVGNNDFAPYDDNQGRFSFDSSAKKQADKSTCKEPLPYEDKYGNCVECLTASQCHKSQDCVDNLCEDCPPNSTRTVRVGQRIGTRNCYCQKGFQLNKEQTDCVPDYDDWHIEQNCVGNNCTTCPENANNHSGQRIAMTNCYCDEGFLPRQTGADQWQCAKVVVLYPEPSNQIIVHDEVYPVSEKKVESPKSTDKVIQPEQKPVKHQHRVKRNSKPKQVIYPPIYDDPYSPNNPPIQRYHMHNPTNFESLFEPVFMPEPFLLPFPQGGNFDIRAWESLEITIQ